MVTASLKMMSVISSAVTITYKSCGSILRLFYSVVKGIGISLPPLLSGNFQPMESVNEEIPNPPSNQQSLAVVIVRELKLVAKLGGLVLADLAGLSITDWLEAKYVNTIPVIKISNSKSGSIDAPNGKIYLAVDVK